MREFKRWCVIGVLAASAACSKNKKPETTPVATSGGETKTDSAPVKNETTAPDKAAANLQDVVYFEFDKSDLDDSAKAKIEENAKWLLEDPKRTLTIEGHTDEVGTPEYNLGLGERRARTTKEYLVRLGVDEKRISIITYGEERPASDQDAMNRRSMFIATKKPN